MSTAPVLNTRAPAFNAIASRVQGADADDENILERDEETDAEASDDDEAIDESGEGSFEDMSNDRGSSTPSVKTVVVPQDSDDTTFTHDILDPEDLPDLGKSLN